MPCLWTCVQLDTVFVQDLVLKNEALRRLIHELQLKSEQQLKQKDAQAQDHEQQIMKRYEGSLSAARQQNADAMVIFCLCFTARDVYMHSAQCCYAPRNCCSQDFVASL